MADPDGPELTLPLTKDADVIAARRETRARAIALGFDLVRQTKIVTAVSELARNTVIHGGGGRMTLRDIDGPPRRGLEITFADEGPGIAQLDLAMTEGWSSGAGLGLGLPGSRRLVNDFAIDSEVGVGTRIRVVMWAGRL